MDQQSGCLLSQILDCWCLPSPPSYPNNEHQRLIPNWPEPVGEGCIVPGSGLVLWYADWTKG